MLKKHWMPGAVYFSQLLYWTFLAPGRAIDRDPEQVQFRLSLLAFHARPSIMPAIACDWCTMWETLIMICVIRRCWHSPDSSHSNVFTKKRMCRHLAFPKYPYNLTRNVIINESLSAYGNHPLKSVCCHGGLILVLTHVNSIFAIQPEKWICLRCPVCFFLSPSLPVVYLDVKKTSLVRFVLVVLLSIVILAERRSCEGEETYMC